MVVHDTAEPTAGKPSRPQVGVSAQTVRTEFLWPAMEATCHNRDQWNPSPEIDSHFERALHALLTGKSRVVVAAHMLAGIQSNHLEGEQVRTVSGAADLLAADLERIVVGHALGIKALCRKLRPILKAIDAGTPAEQAEALSGWRDIHRLVPCAELTRPGVRRELGKQLSAVMDRLLQDGAA